MVELQSCASLVNASSLCAIEQEMKEENVNVLAEISAELQRERQKNAELMEKISLLEAQIEQRDKDFLLSNGQSRCPNARERCFKKFRRQKIEPNNEKIEDGSTAMASQINRDVQCMQNNNANKENHLVNWMSMDDTQFLYFEKLKDGDSAADCNDTDDSDDEDDEYFEENDIRIDHTDGGNGEIKAANELKEHLEEDVDQGMHIPCLKSSSGCQGEPTPAQVSQEMNEDQNVDSLPPDIRFINNKRELKKHGKKETKMVGDQASLKNLTSVHEVKGSGGILLQKKPPKLAFCPKEVKRIIESESLSLKNAQSHTIRKIIVFASLGIRHGCEDMYELDFNHFSILRKGEAYVSSKDPGEHVLYENPGVRRKVFYPNRHNPILCPVQILEEEKAMRPSDVSCPSCLFLCIKYGGRTRNLPQNEYVRQRMGRNKLKSFGPVMCRMAMLVHIRSGSFFFKALGITLLFMAGFSDDLVQKETKYRNLDLLQKYYRTDEDAEGEELFLLHPMTSDTQVSPNSLQLTGKTISTKSKGKKHANSISKPHNLKRASILQSPPSSAAPSTQFGLLGNTSIQTHATTAFQSPSDSQPISDPVITSSGLKVSYSNQTSYSMFPPHPANAFVPMMYWPPHNAFPPCPYPSSYGYQSFPSTGNFISIHPQSYYSHPSSNPLIPKMVKGTGKNDATSEEADSDSNSSSSSTEPKEA
ncbi:hypothetical protein F0562_018883 [Nyssa sinensis]|uniref:Uncharacterized protein n=1 Tax=Nyssa sinensis TaxID=561372 RepID=A0A5J4ZA96_9ASTE|nr:hypothetical protein F0562_018883 [Nyssa sinensis]